MKSPLRCDNVHFCCYIFLIRMLRNNNGGNESQEALLCVLWGLNMMSSGSIFYFPKKIKSALFFLKMQATLRRRLSRILRS